MGSDVSSSAKMQPIAQMSGRGGGGGGEEVRSVQLRASGLEAAGGRGLLTDGFGIVPSPEQKLGRSVPESDHHGVKIG